MFELDKPSPIESIEQDSDEWHQFRSEGIGSSDIGSVMGLNTYKSLRKLWQEKTGQIDNEYEQNEYTQYGKHKEKYAVTEYEWQYGVSGFKPCLFIHPKYSFIRASFDAYHAELKYGLEIKSPYNPKNREVAASGGIDKKYYAQLQWLMLASQTQMIKYVVFDGSHQLWVKDVFRDEKYQRKMIRYGQWFWDCIRTKTDPKKRKPKFTEITNKDVR